MVLTAMEGAFHHEDVAVPHLAQPCPGHPGTDAGVVDERDARVPHGDPLVGRLHQLSAGRVAAERAMAGQELVRVPDIQYIHGAARVLLEAGQIERADHADARGLGKCRGAL